jgi:predicted MFS family arabinose efflux permease
MFSAQSLLKPVSCRRPPFSPLSVQAGQTQMTDSRLELADNESIAPPWPQRLGTLSVFLANGLGIGAWAAAIPRIKADLALSDAGLSFALLAFAAGGIVAMPLTGLLAHRFRSGLASLVGGFAFAAAIAAIGFAPSLEILSATAFLAGMTSGVMDVAMNANASDIERRWRRPLMSSFHAAFSLGGAVGAVLGGWLGARGTALGLLGPALLSSLLVAVAVPFLIREGHGFHGAGFAVPSRRLLPLAVLSFVLMATEGAVGDWSGTYLARSGVGPGATAAAYAAFSLLMITGRIVGDGIVGAAGSRATVGFGALIAGTGLAISAAWPGLAGGVVGFGLVGAGLANVIPVLFSVAGRIGSSPAVGVASAATAGYAGLLIGPVVIGAVASGVGLRPTIVMLAGVALLSAMFAASKAGGLARGR